MSDEGPQPTGASGWQPQSEDAATTRSTPWERRAVTPSSASEPDSGPDPEPSGRHAAIPVEPTAEPIAEPIPEPVAETTAASGDDAATTVLDPVPNQPAPSPPHDVIRLVARGIGQTLITAGLVVLLFVVYELWITDIFSAHKQAQATAAMDQAWSSAVPSASASGPASAASAASAAPVSGGSKVVTVADPDTLVTDPRTRKVDYQTEVGEGFAKIFIPSFGPDYVYTVIEGTNADDLDVGPGHYEGTQLPGQPGNFAMAGHRVSKGSPFNALGQLNSCDALIIETKNDWFVYRVLPMQNEVSGWNAAGHAHCTGVSPLTGPYQGVFGREITDPSDYAQVEPVPHVNSAVVPANAQRLLTLTTCHPQFSDTQRMIIHGVLVKSYQKAAGFTPPELGEG